MITKHKAMRGKLIVSVNMSQKNDFEIEIVPGVKIWMNRDFGVDGKITNPSLAFVKAVGKGVEDIAPGDMILCHHNSFKRVVSNGYLLGNMGTDEVGLQLFSLEYGMAWLKVDTDGNVHPLKGYLTVERIEDKPDTFLEVPDTAIKYFRNRFRILRVGADCPGLFEGDIIETNTFSDVDVHYTYQLKPYTVTRVSYNDVLLIHNK